MIDEPLRDFDMHIVTDSYGNKSLWTRVTTTTGTYDSVIRISDLPTLTPAELIEEFISPALLDLYEKTSN